MPEGDDEVNAAVTVDGGTFTDETTTPVSKPKRRIKRWQLGLAVGLIAVIAVGGGTVIALQNHRAASPDKAACGQVDQIWAASTASIAKIGRAIGSYDIGTAQTLATGMTDYLHQFQALSGSDKFNGLMDTFTTVYGQTVYAIKQVSFGADSSMIDSSSPNLIQAHNRVTDYCSTVL